MSKDSTSTSTHFGFQQVPVAEKNSKVREVFDSVASRYDIMNDAMSLGIHRLWKRRAMLMSFLQPGHQVLDLASGTADMAALACERVGKQGRVFVTDLNEALLSVGRDRMIDKGHLGNVVYKQVNAEQLPFEDNQFDCVMMAFGLRNVTHKEKALAEMHRVLKPGGRTVILEFSKPKSQCLSKIYDAYSFHLLPKLGQWIAGDEDSYRYLVESIRMHPDQETLKQMILDAGFDRCQYFNFTGGIVACHQGTKS